MGELKCKKCVHFYRVMVTENGYNPYPSCQCLEDTGRRPNILTQECFEKRKPAKEGMKKNGNSKGRRNEIA